MRPSLMPCGSVATNEVEVRYELGNDAVLGWSRSCEESG